MKRIFVIILFFVLLCPQHAFSGEDAKLYVRARREAQTGQIDFAYMHFRTIVSEYPSSRHREEALFAVGEYYFKLKKYRQARSYFRELYEDYPKSAARLFVQAYLHQIARLQQQEETAFGLLQEIMADKKVSLVFKDFDEYKYTSPLMREYTAVFQIDQMEFFVEGDLFAKIKY